MKHFEGKRTQFYVINCGICYTGYCYYDRYSTNMTTTKYLLYRCVFHGVQVMNTCWIVLIVFKENKNTTILIGRTLPLNKYYCRCPI